MKEFFEKNKLVLAIVVGALIIGGGVYFGLKNKEVGNNDTPVSEANSRCLAPSEVVATKIIDGDTVVVEGGYHVRLLGMDTDEVGYPCYGDAKTRLEELVLNKKIRLEKDKTDIDQYKRCLRYIFLDKQNIDLQLVKEGLAVARFYEPDVRYKDEITLAEKTAIDAKVGCKWGSQKNTPAVVSGKFEELTSEKTGLEVVGACNAGNYYGKEVIVEGNIVSAYKSGTNTVFLNFEKPYPNSCFTSVIFSSDQYKFVQNPESYYSDKNVRIKGKIKEYQGKPEIILNDPLQIEISK
ncbi:MAG: thermonuclease family protein [bacterium]|nr:thermonuclease family protein [bacterium]